VAAQRLLGLREPTLRGWAETFAPGGKVPETGQLFRAPGHAAALRRLAEVGVDDFYSGQIAHALLQHSRATGGVLCADDLATHESEWVEPISVTYRGHQIWQLPPHAPGITTLLGLG